jgi:Protein of unknown function (DUF1501)
MPISACPGPRLTRRQMLQIGSAGLVGLSLPSFLRARATGDLTPTADHLIVLFLNGGPSHLDMWDMKPNAPVEIRGEFNPIATSVPGVQFSEHLPRLARHMHQCTVVRSVHHGVNNAHAAAVYAGMTGHDRGEIGGGARPTDHPALGSVAGLVRPVASGVVPYVSLPFITKEGAGGPPQPGFTGGWLGNNVDPLFVLRDPNSPAFDMPELGLGADMNLGRLSERRTLSGQVGAASTPGVPMDDFQARAFDLLTSSATQRAFQIQREPSHLRDQYGRNIYGQSVLLSRRLIEAGTRVVALSWAPDANATWDTHGNNFTKLRNELLPQLDRAVSSLLADLDARGMLSRTLVAVMGEFGRTPRINGSGGGRDHWNFCYSLMLAGGGIKAGYIHGASDRIGGRPSLNPVTPADIIATIYRCLGIPADLELRDRLGRPISLVPWGNVIGELLA